MNSNNRFIHMKVASIGKKNLRHLLLWCESREYRCLRINWRKGIW